MTSAVPDLAEDAFRDYVIDGVPSSGAYEPPKVDIRSLFDTLGAEIDGIAPGAAAAAAAAEAAAAAAEAAAANAALGYLSFATIAEMEAVTTADDNQTAYVAENDSYYAWDDGGSEWVFIRVGENTRIEAVEARVIPVVLTANHTTSAAAEVLHCDTSAGGFMVTLDATPADLAEVTIVDIRASFATNNLIVDGNGKTIGGTGTSVRCREVNPVTIVLTFDDDADFWRATVLS